MTTPRPPPPPIPSSPKRTFRLLLHWTIRQQNPIPTRPSTFRSPTTTGRGPSGTSLSSSSSSSSSSAPSPSASSPSSIATPITPASPPSLTTPTPVLASKTHSQRSHPPIGFASIPYIRRVSWTV